jgi:hypothetical protein
VAGMHGAENSNDDHGSPDRLQSTLVDREIFICRCGLNRGDPRVVVATRFCNIALLSRQTRHELPKRCFAEIDFIWQFPCCREPAGAGSRAR